MPPFSSVKREPPSRTASRTAGQRRPSRGIGSWPRQVTTVTIRSHGRTKRGQVTSKKDTSPGATMK